MHATIGNLHSLHELLEHACDPETLLFLDIDNTLMEPYHNIGSEQWERHVAQEYIREGMDEKKAYLKASYLWKAMQMVIKVKFIENEIPELIKKIEGQGIPITLLTARSEDVAQITLEQLGMLGVNFEKKDRIRHLLSFSESEAGLYERGVIFCNGLNKGKVLKTYLHKHQEIGKKVIVVDDKLENLLHIKEELQGSCPYKGFRFALLDDKVKNYYPDEISALLHRVFAHPSAIDFLARGFSDAS